MHKPLALIAPAPRIGSREHWIAIDQNKENVRSFGVYTQDHQQLILHLQQHGITSVAMESTGSYWQTLFSALQEAGFFSGRADEEVSRRNCPIASWVVATGAVVASAFRFEPLYDSKNILSWKTLKMRESQCQWGYPTVFG